MFSAVILTNIGNGRVRWTKRSGDDDKRQVLSDQHHSKVTEWAGVTAHTYCQIPQIQLISGCARQLVNSGGKKTAGQRPASNSATAPVRAGPAPSHRAAAAQGKSEPRQTEATGALRGDGSTMPYPTLQT